MSNLKVTPEGINDYLIGKGQRDKAGLMLGGLIPRAKMFQEESLVYVGLQRWE